MKYVAYILLVLSWPVTLAHRMYNNSDVILRSWFVFKPDISQDIQWYIADTGNMASVLFLLSGIYFYLISLRNTSYSIPMLVLALMVVQALDIVSYWLFFKQSETILFFQGGIILIALLIIILKKNAATNGS